MERLQSLRPRFGASAVQVQRVIKGPTVEALSPRPRSAPKMRKCCWLLYLNFSVFHIFPRSVFPNENTDLGEFRGNTPIANARPCIGNMKLDPPGREKWGISLTEWDFPEMRNSTIRACAFSERGSKSARGCVFSSLTTFLTQRAQELAHG